MIEYPCTNLYCLSATHPVSRCPNLPPQRLPPYNAAESRSFAHIRDLQRQGRLPEFEVRDAARWPWVFLLGLLTLVTLGLMLLI